MAIPEELLDAARRAVPPLTGEVRLPGLSAPATLLRDRLGVPHLRAATARDAFFAQGFAHAQDRLFQMELNRRRALGRSAEWLGPAAFEADALARRLGVEAASRRDAAALGSAGWGEVFSSPFAAAAFIKARLAPLVLGQSAREVHRLHHAMTATLGYDRRGAAMMAVSAMDMALHDLAARSLGVSVARMLGGALRDRVLAYASGPFGTWKRRCLSRQACPRRWTAEQGAATLCAKLLG